jgi:hypothetical protein
MHVQHLVRSDGLGGHDPLGGYPSEGAAAAPGAAWEGHDTTGGVQQRAPQGEGEARGEQWTHDAAGELPDDGTGQPHTGR